ncbi:hypothetical protein WCQ02_39545 [Paraburkholderia tropica]|uniref:hypothetical protein n=1 Tax=Paraburkholderia tropica TaxID=92647 RepID=UPI00301B689C
MTLAEVAVSLFVSRAHVTKLLESGKLNEVLPKSPYRTLDIDVASVEEYKAELETATQEYLDSYTEDDDALEP